MMMIQFKALCVILCLMGLLSETLCSVTLEAEAGDNVTMWCKHELKRNKTFFWFKQTCDSVPLLIGCKNLTSAPPENCMDFTESERTVMSVKDKKTSLSITAVNVSDTGLYYCSFMKHHKVSFSNSTYLRVKGSDSSAAFFWLSVMCSVVTGILLGVLTFVLLKHRKTHRGAQAKDNQAPNSDSVNYAAVQFKKETRRTEGRDDQVDPHVIYSSVR